jgi:hypothetical protein
MDQPKSPSYTIFTTAAGTHIVGEEIGRKDGIIELKWAHFIEIHPSMTRFNLQAIRYVDPQKTFMLYQSALLGEQELPEIMRADFERAVAQK